MKEIHLSLPLSFYQSMKFQPNVRYSKNPRIQNWLYNLKCSRFKILIKDFMQNNSHKHKYPCPLNMQSFLL